MEAWKETLADRMVSWDYKLEKGRLDPNEYYIIVTCQGNGGVEAVSRVMREHMGSLCSDFKNMWFYTNKNGLVKRNDSFWVQVGSKQAQDQLKRNLNNIVTEVEKYRQEQSQKTNDELVSNIKKRNYAVLAAVAILGAAIAWYLWS